MNTKNLTLIALCILTASLSRSFGQNALQFTGVNATPENAIQLHWASNTNEIYEIDYANALGTNSDGSTAWQKLYDDYPSQGTNTLWLDTGNYNQTPSILHPKYMPTRFYRVVLAGTNTIAVNPTITINAITNGQIVFGSLNVSVSASSPDIIANATLYVDGQAMNPSLDGTNFTINTCEWWNGQHTLYATVKSQSSLEGTIYNTGIAYGYGVSPMVDVIFNNLVSEIQFSQPFFQPSLGQTQHVSAVFPLNSDWTLNIQDINSNIVRTVTGSGNYLNFDWDGTGNGGTNIADGVYTYLISASTNGLANEVITNGGGGVNTNSPPSPGVMSEEMLWAANSDDESVVPLALYPPSVDTNGLTIFSATPSEVRSLHPTGLHSSLRHASLVGGGFTPSYVPITPLPGDPQDAPPAPNRPPNDGVKGVMGTFGIAYQTFGNHSATVQNPATGWPYLSGQPSFVAIDGFAATGTYHPLASLAISKIITDQFSSVIQKADYYQSFCEVNDDVTVHALQSTAKGGLSVFNDVNFGFLLTHGSYATAAESDGVKYTYMWFENIAHSQISYMKLSDFSFGGSAPSGLRWMTLFVCSALNQTDWNSMVNHSKNPINSNLHALLGANTTIYGSNKIGQLYAQNLVNGETVINAWYDAGTAAYQNTSITNVVTFANVRDQNCVNDTLQSFQSPGGGLQYDQKTVFTP